MADEKKVIFTGVDNVTAKANQIYSGILAAAQKQTTTIKEQNNFISQQLKLLEQKQKLESKSNSDSLEDLKKRKEALPPGMERYRAEQAVRTKGQELGKKETEDSKIVALLKELVATQKKDTSIAEKIERETIKENQRKAKYEDLRGARTEARANPKLIRQRYAAAEAGGYEGMSASQVERLQYQNKVIGDDKTKSSTFKDMFLALMANDAVRNVSHAIVSSPTGEQAINSLLGAIPFVGGLFGGASKRTFEEQVAVGIGNKRLGAMSGRDIANGGNTALGFSSRESLGLQEGLMLAAGSSGKLGANTGSAQSLMKGMGLSEQALVQIVKDVRTTRSDADMVGIVSRVLKVNPDLKDDQTKTAEILSNLSSATNTIASRTENLDQGKLIDVMGRLRSVGGTFADPSLGLRNVMNMDQSLSNPSSDFQRARSFSVLNQMNPGASYLQTMIMQEKGLGQQGFLSNMLKQLKRETGGGENFALSIMNNLGLGAGTSNKLAQAFSKNPKLLDSFTGTMNEDKINEIISGKRAEEHTAKRDREAAEASEAFLKGGGAGVNNMINQTLNDATGHLKDGAQSLARAAGMEETNITKFGIVLDLILHRLPPATNGAKHK